MPEGLTLISCLGPFSEENPRTGKPTKKELIKLQPGEEFVGFLEKGSDVIEINAHAFPEVGGGRVWVKSPGTTFIEGKPIKKNFIQTAVVSPNEGAVLGVVEAKGRILPETTISDLGIMEPKEPTSGIR